MSSAFSKEGKGSWGKYPLPSFDFQLPGDLLRVRLGANGSEMLFVYIPGTEQLVRFSPPNCIEDKVQRIEPRTRAVRNTRRCVDSLSTFSPFLKAGGTIRQCRTTVERNTQLLWEQRDFDVNVGQCLVPHENIAC